MRTRLGFAVIVILTSTQSVSRCTSTSFSDFYTTRSVGTFRSALTLNFYF
jgi:hypothetical protein